MVKKNYEIVKYDCGHIIDVPYAPVCKVAGHPMLPKGTLMMFGGSNTKAHTMSQLHLWEKIRSFFKETL